VIDTMPAESLLLDQIEPVFETLPGWPEPTCGVTSFEELPAERQGLPGLPRAADRRRIRCISTGPGRMETIPAAGVEAGKIPGLTAPPGGLSFHGRGRHDGRAITSATRP